MAEFTWLPDYGAAKQSKAIVRQAKFGDGYSQRARFGINDIDENWQVTFTNRDQTEADEIEDFFQERAGTQSFSWLPPGEDAEQSFIATEWNKSVPHAGLYTITATFQRSYDP